MTRRLVLLSPAAAATPPPVTDTDKLNEFAELYNGYVAGLRDGKLDLKLWRQVCRAWRGMVRTDGE